MKSSLSFCWISMMMIMLPFSGNAQQPTFSRVFLNFYGYNDAQAYSVTETQDSSYLLAGFYNNNALILKIGDNGQKKWDKQFDFGASTIFMRIIPTDDVHFLAAGIGGVNKNIVMLKLNNNGDTIWTRSLDVGIGEHITSLHSTNDSGFIIGGILYGYSDYDSAMVVKLDKDGNPEWVLQFTPEGSNSNLFSVRPTGTGDFLLCGSYQTTNPYQVKPFLIRIDEEGNLLWAWELSFNPYENQYGYDVVETSNGYIILTGQNPYYITHIDYAGNTIWSKNMINYGFTANNFELGSKLHVGTDSTFFFVSIGQWGHFTHIDQYGEPIWNKELWLDAVDGILTSDSGFLVLGNGPLWGVDGYNPYPLQIGTIKTDAEGTTSYCMYESGYISDLADIAVNPISIVLVPAIGFSAHEQIEISEAGLLEFDGCVELTPGIGEKSPLKSILTLSPNPSTGTVTLTMEPTTTGAVTIRVFNATGNLVYQTATAISLPTSLNLSHLPNGIYLLQATSSQLHVSSKLMLNP